jgi:hypothetical protein
MSSNGDVVADDGNGYRYLTASTSGGYMGAVLQLPAGAMIDELGVNACTGATGDLTVGLFDDGILGNPASLLGSLTTTTHGVCFFQTVGQINHLYDHAFQHPLQLVVHLNGPMDGALKFNHVFVQYHLTVSPPPGVATFGDVPTSHPFFQFVEALAASGITAGCGNGNFCPDQPLTRGQMAVFLSKALGLNWPN